MSGETEAEVSGWTVDTLHQHIRVQLADMRRQLDERYATQTKALDAAFVAQETATRAALAEQQRSVATRVVADDQRFALLNELRQGVATKEQFEALALRLSDIKERLDRSEGHSEGLSAGWGLLIGAVGLAGAVIGIVVGTR